VRRNQFCLRSFSCPGRAQENDRDLTAGLVHVSLSPLCSTPPAENRGASHAHAQFLRPRIRPLRGLNPS
jgi:hypothetical protein